MFNLFVFSFDISVIFNILKSIIKILQEKMLKAINLYWFHNDVSEKIKSLNANSSEPRING